MNTYSSSSNRPCEASSFKLVAVVLLLALCTITMVPSAWSQEGAAPAAPQSSEGSEGGNASNAGMQVAAVVSTLFYVPFKLAFAIGGGVVGGLAYAFSGGNEQAAKSIWTTSIYGTYLITPDHLEGNRPIRFLGVADPSDAPVPTPTPAPAPEPIR